MTSKADIRNTTGRKIRNGVLLDGNKKQQKNITYGVLRFGLSDIWQYINIYVLFYKQKTIVC